MADEQITLFETDLRVARLEGRFDVLQPQLLTQPFVFQGTDGVATTASGGFLPFDRDFKFFKNLTGGSVEVRVTIINKSKSEMLVKIDDKQVAKIPAGGNSALVIELETGQSLCADEKGEYRIDK